MIQNNNFFTNLNSLSTEDLDAYHVTYYEKTGPQLEQKACSFFGKTIRQLYKPLTYVVGFLKTLFFGTSYSFEYNAQKILKLIDTSTLETSERLRSCAKMRELAQSVLTKKYINPAVLTAQYINTSCALLKDEAQKQDLLPHELACRLSLFFEAQYLINNGATPQTLSQESKNNLLGYALDHNSFTFAEKLITTGADPKSQKTKLSAFLTHAIWQKNSALSVALLDAGADRGKPGELLRRTVELGLIQVVQKLAELGENLSVRDKNHNSLLHTAALYSRFELVDWLSLKIDISLKNSRGHLAYEQIKNRPHFTDKQPLEKAFLLQDISECQKILASLGQEGAIQALETLRATFPATYVNHILYAVDEQHFHNRQGIVLPQTIAPGYTVSDLLTLFDQVNFSDSYAEHYADPASFQSDTGTRNPATLRSMLSGFINKVNYRTAYLGTPAAGSGALETFYNSIERAVTHTIRKIVEMPESNDKKQIIKRTIIEFLRASGYCGGRIYANACQQYFTVTTGQAPTFKDELLNTLGSYREVLLQTVMPNQDVHTFNHVMHHLGKKLGIPGAEMMQGFDDMYGGYNINYSNLQTAFKALYNSKNIIFECIKPAIEQTADLRNKLLDWCKENLPQEWHREEFQEIYSRVEELEANQAPRQEICAYLQSKDIYAAPNQSYQQAIQDERKMRYLALEVVVDMESPVMQIKPEAIAYMLCKQGILQPVYDCPAYYGTTRMITAKIGSLLKHGRNFFSSLFGH